MARRETKQVQWLRDLQEGDWLVDDPEGLAYIVIKIKRTYNTFIFLCSRKDGSQFWTDETRVKPPHRIRYRPKPKVQEKPNLRLKKLTKETVGPRKYRVITHNIERGIPTIRKEDVTSHYDLYFPCLVYEERDDELYMEYFKHVYAKPRIKTVKKPYDLEDELALHIATALGRKFQH